MNPSRAILALALFACPVSARAVVVTLDPGAAGAARAQDAEREISRLLGPAAARNVKGTAVSYRAAAWSSDVAPADRALALAGLRAAWGPALTVLEDGASGAAGGNAAPETPSNARAAEQALDAVPADAAAGRFDKAYDGTAAHAAGAALPAVPAGGAAGPAGAKPGLSRPTAAAVALPVFDPAAMDASVDPCADFYRYACGTWLKNNPVPPDRTTWMRFTSLDEQTLGILREILEAAASQRDAARKSEDEKKIGGLYAACMDKTGADAKGAAPLKADLAAIDGLTGKRGLAKLVAREHLLGAGPLFGLGSGQDYQNASRVIAVVDQGGISLPDRDYYVKDEYAGDVASFTAHVARMFVLLGDTPGQAADEAARVVAVETGLAKVSADATSRRDPKTIHHKTTLAGLAKACPAFDWPAYLKAIGAPAKGPLDDMSPAFFTGLSKLIGATDVASWKSYLRWQLVHAQAGLLSSDFVDENFAYFGRALNGQQELRPRWKRCVGLVDGSIGDALGRAYVQKEFGADKKALTLDMVRQIEAAMGADIRSLDWMSPETRKKALGKLAKVANKIGYPDQWRDYSSLSIDSGDLAGDAARANGFEFRRQLAKIGKPVDRGEWGMTAPTDNDYYDSQLNDINFPAGSLQPPLFDAAAPAAANFGAVGATMGHELTHAFDDEGRHYDADGNLKDWWTAADSQKFEERAKGFVDEYSGFYAVRDPKDPSKDVKVNGRLTLGENLADDGGLRLAYAAYHKTAMPDGAVGGYSGDKLFFLSYGQSWCGNQTPESARVQAASDPHSPPEARVNGVLRNNRQFRDAFACHEGASMAPKDAHRVW